MKLYMLPNYKKFINKYIVLLFLVIFIFTTIAINHTHKIITSQVLRELQRNHEQKSWETLKLFHATTQNALVEQIEHPIGTLEALAKDSEVKDALSKNDMESLNSILYKQLTVNKHFDAFIILDKNGIGITNATDAPNKEDLLGKDYSSQEFFKYPKKNLKSYISKVKMSAGTNNYIVAVSTPISNSLGELENVLVASIRVKNITNRITLPNQISDYSFVLTDSSGTLIYDGENITSDPPNLRSNDRVIQRLTEGETEIFEQEINYKNVLSLAYGSHINILNEKFFLTVYYPTAAFDLEHQVISGNIKLGLLKIIYLDYLLATIVFLLVFVLLISHAKNEIKNRI